MTTTMGSLFAREPRHKQRANSVCISIGETFAVELLYNDVPAILMHRRGNGPWQYIPITREFKADRVPRNSDVQLSAIVSGTEKVIYKLDY